MRGTQFLQIIFFTVVMGLCLTSCIQDGSALELTGTWQSIDDSRTIMFAEESYTVNNEDVRFDLGFKVLEHSEGHALLAISESAGTQLMVRSLSPDRIRLQIYPQPGVLQSEEEFVRVTEHPDK